MAILPLGKYASCRGTDRSIAVRGDSVGTVGGIRQQIDRGHGRPVSVVKGV